MIYMMTSLEKARLQLETWCVARARAGLVRGSRLVVEQQARSVLASGELRELMQDADLQGLLTAEEHGAMLDHLSLAARDEILARAHVEPLLANGVKRFQKVSRRLHEWAHLALEDHDPLVRAQAMKAVAHADDLRRTRRIEAMEEARELASKVRRRGPRSNDSDPDELARKASKFLDTTADAARELMTYMARSRGVKRPRTALDMFVLLRGAGNPWRASTHDRPRRIASMLGPLGLQDEFARRAKLGEAHRELDFNARIVTINPPHDVVILPPPLELGLITELSMTHAIGRGLATILVAPGLPPALRRAWPGSFARGLGELFTGLYTEPGFLRRAHGLSGTELEGVALSSLALVLFRARMLAAYMVSSELEGQDRIEGGREQLAHAFVCTDGTVPDALADASTLTPDERRADLRAALVAPSIAFALRERFDEDWFRNPRVEEPIRAASARGGAFSIEAWAAEFGVNTHRPHHWFTTKVRTV